VETLHKRAARIPRDNLARWKSWLDFIQPHLESDDISMLTTRANIANWTGRNGDVRRALELHEALLPDRVRGLGADHPKTLRTRANIANWTGQTGNMRRALELHEALLPDRVRVLGADHPDTLRTRANIADCTKLGGAKKIAAIIRNLLANLHRDVNRKWRR